MRDHRRIILRSVLETMETRQAFRSGGTGYAAMPGHELDRDIGPGLIYCWLKAGGGV
jgi:hypothetical protein